MAKRKQEVSFKNTSRDIRLYTLIDGLEEKSDYIKNAIEFYDKYSKYSFEIELLLKNLEEDKK